MERIKLNQFYQHIGLTDHFDQLHIKKNLLDLVSIYIWKKYVLMQYPSMRSKDFIERKLIWYMDEYVKTSDKVRTSRNYHYDKVDIICVNEGQEVGRWSLGLNSVLLFLYFLYSFTSVLVDILKHHCIDFW